MWKVYKRQVYKNRGVTLVETLVYIAIVVIVFSIMTGALILVVRVYEETAKTRSINASATISFERILRDIREASSVDVSNSVLGINPGKLVLISGGTTTEFFVLDGAIWFRENGVTKYPLTESMTTTTNLVFRHILNANSSAVRVEMTFQAGTSTSFKSESFHSTAVLRNSY